MFGVYAPETTPPDAMARMNREMHRLLAQPAVKARFSELGADAKPTSPAELRATVQTESQLFGAAVKASGIKAD